MFPWILVTLLLLQIAPSHQQSDVVSPLSGQGSPANETTDIYMSVFIDRMFDVDELQYRHEEILLFYISWYDPTATDTIEQYTALANSDSNYTCSRPCYNLKPYNSLCCDGIYMPTFVFKNVVNFPTDRPSQVSVYENNTVVWTVFAHTECYQTLDFHNYPFDSFSLLILIQFQDSQPPNHPGIKLHKSASGPEMLTIGKGDSVSKWAVNYMNLTVVRFPIQNRFVQFATSPSNPNDPFQLVTADGGTEDYIAAAYTQWLAVTVRVTRYSTYPIMQSILPISICAFLGLAIAFVPMRDLHARLELVVVLFLALTAVQFVLASEQPASSYVIPTQQYILATYILLAAIALESIVVHKLCVAKDRAEQERVQRQARERVQRAMKLSRVKNITRNRRDFGSGLPVLNNNDNATPLNNNTNRRISLETPSIDPSIASPDTDARIAQIAKAAAGLSNRNMMTPSAVIEENGNDDYADIDGGNTNKCTSWKMGSACGLFARKRSSKSKNNQFDIDDDDQKNKNSGEKLTWWSAAQMDENYAEDLARRIDMWSIISLAVAYAITAILIFTLQNGYIALFRDFTDEDPENLGVEVE